MAYSDIRAEIGTILAAVSGIGVVHDYRRWTNREEEFKTFYESNSIINGWEYTRRGFSDNFESTGPRYERIHDFLIVGYYGLDDSAASEKANDTLVESIASAFRAKPDLNGKCQMHEFIQGEVIELRMFADTLVHYTELGLLVHEEVT